MGTRRIRKRNTKRRKLRRTQGGADQNSFKKDIENRNNWERWENKKKKTTPWFSEPYSCKYIYPSYFSWSQERKPAADGQFNCDYENAMSKYLEAHKANIYSNKDAESEAAYEDRRTQINDNWETEGENIRARMGINRGRKDFFKDFF